MDGQMDILTTNIVSNIGYPNMKQIYLSIPFTRHKVKKTITKIFV